MARQHRPQLFQGNIVLPLDGGMDERGVVLDLRRTAITALRLGRRRAVLNHQLPPTDRARRTDPQPLRRGPARHPAFNRGNHPVPQIT